MTATRLDAQVARAILERLRSITTSPVLPIAYPDTKFTRPADNGPYLQASLFFATTATISIGDDDPNQILGFLQVEVVWPEGRGEQEASEVASQVIDHFSRGTVMTEGTTKVKVVQAPYKMTVLKDPPYTRTPVTVRFESFASH